MGIAVGGSHIWLGCGLIRGRTREKSPTPAVTAANVSLSLERSKSTLAYTQVRGRLPAEYVKKASLTDQGYASIIVLSMD